MAKVESVTADLNTDVTLVLVATSAVVACLNMACRATAVSAQCVAVITVVGPWDRRELDTVTTYLRASVLGVTVASRACPASLNGASG